MERFVIIVNGWKPLTIITKRSILDIAPALDPPLKTLFSQNRHELSRIYKVKCKPERVVRPRFLILLLISHM